MINSLRIRNYKSCKDVSIEHLGAVVALIGQNGVGKSNLLRALEWVAKVATTADGFFHHHLSPPFQSAPSTIVEMKLTLDGVRHDYSVERLFKVNKGADLHPRIEIVLNESLYLIDDKGARTLILSRQNQDVTSPLRAEPLRVGSNVGVLFGLWSLLPSGDPLAQAIKPVSAFFSTMKYYPIDEPCVPRDSSSQVIPEAQYKSWAASFAETGSADDSVIMPIIHMWITMKERFDELKHLLGDDGLGVISDIDIGKFEVNDPKTTSNKKLVFFIPQFRPSRAGAEFSFENLSAGTRRIIRLLVGLLFDSPEVMLLEHPEDGIHKGLVRKVISVLRTTTHSSQVIMASHSATVLNECEPSEIRIVAMKSGATSVHALTKKELKAAESYLDDDGTLVEFLDLVEED